MVDIKNIKKGMEVWDELVEAGIGKEIADEAGLAEAEFAACLPVTQENLDGVIEQWRSQIAYDHCGDCGVKIFYRDNMPEHIKRICMPCALDRMAENDQNEILVRKEGADEVREYFKKKGQN